LLAALRGEDARILIPGFYDDVRALTPAEQAAIDALPLMETDLMRDLGIARVEGAERLLEATAQPALNIRGIVVGGVGENATNAVPTEAHASIDFRLVPDQTPEAIRARLEAWLKERGWHVVSETPDPAMRLAHPRIIKIGWSSGYAAVRTDMTLPSSRAVLGVMERWQGSRPMAVPMLGGSLPMAYFAETGAPLILVPMVNHDNNQHGVNENLRLQNLWDGIEVYAGLIADLNW
jgi:acetylornithine deacetylase/succinyl-diaminopimelate desuccinylase-like protein